MAVPNQNNKPSTFNTPQDILNRSFDRDTNTSTVQTVEYDPSGSLVRKITQMVKTLVDVPDASTTYIGKATHGTATNAASWQILKISEAGTLTTMVYADGNADFDNVFDDRTGLSYS